MAFSLKKLLQKSSTFGVKKEEPVVKKEEKKVEEPEPFQIYIPAYEPESEDEVVVPKIKTVITERKVPLNPLSDE
jgi:hypothetical protein